MWRTSAHSAFASPLPLALNLLFVFAERIWVVGRRRIWRRRHGVDGEGQGAHMQTDGSGGAGVRRRSARASACNKGCKLGICEGNVAVELRLGDMVQPPAAAEQWGSSRWTDSQVELFKNGCDELRR